jgi:hypothetical protein
VQGSGGFALSKLAIHSAAPRAAVPQGSVAASVMDDAVLEALRRRRTAPSCDGIDHFSVAG